MKISHTSQRQFVSRLASFALAIFAASNFAHAHDWHFEHRLPTAVVSNCVDSEIVETNHRQSVPNSKMMLPVRRDVFSQFLTPLLSKAPSSLAFDSLAFDITQRASSLDWLSHFSIEPLDTSTGPRIVVHQSVPGQPPIPTVLPTAVSDYDLLVQHEYCYSEEYRPYEMTDSDHVLNHTLPMDALTDVAAEASTLSLTENQQCVALDAFAQFIENVQRFAVRPAQQLELAATASQGFRLLQSSPLAIGSAKLAARYSDVFATTETRAVAPQYVWIQNSRGDRLLVPSELARTWTQRETLPVLEFDSLKTASNAIVGLAKRSVANVSKNVTTLARRAGWIGELQSDQLAGTSSVRR